MPALYKPAHSARRSFDTALYVRPAISTRVVSSISLFPGGRGQVAALVGHVIFLVGIHGNEAGSDSDAYCATRTISPTLRSPRQLGQPGELAVVDVHDPPCMRCG